LEPGLCSLASSPQRWALASNSVAERVLSGNDGAALLTLFAGFSSHGAAVVSAAATVLVEAGTVNALISRCSAS
jgi:hypothetical protein